MKRVGCVLFLVVMCGVAWAENYPRQECLGRVAFNTPEPMEWAVFPAESVYHLADAGGGGASFTESIGGRGENVGYDFDGVTIYISAETTHDEFDGAASYIHGRVEVAKKRLNSDLKIDREILHEFKKNGESADAIRKVEERIQDIESRLSHAGVTEHDLGIPDSRVLGSATNPYYFIIWRNQRVYFFNFSDFSKPTTFDRVKDLASRFRTRELYEVPKEPGICFPYGFIADDGKTAYRVKNSLRFTRTPNVIFSMIVASADDPSKLDPTNGLYDTDIRPGYDGKRWQKTSLVDGLYFGKHLAAFTGWRLDPKPGSDERERAWFGYAYTGGPLSSRPLMGVHVFTFEKSVDNLTEHTPPPEDVLPRLKALTSSMSVR